MKTGLWGRVLGSAALALGVVPLLAVGAGGAAAEPAHGWSYDCTGGNIPAGVYGSVIVTGVCYTPAGNVDIRRDLTIAPGALLDAVTSGDPTTGTPVVPATVDVGGNVLVRSGGVLLLGCSPNITCTNPPGITYDHIGGNLTAYDAEGVVVHSATIDGDVSLIGGGGGTNAVTCNAQTPGTPVVTTLEPWSEDATLDYTPVYSDFEDSTIGGDLTISGLTSCWLGSLRDQIGGDATFTHLTMGDPDAMEIGSNLISGDLSCWADSPAPQFGDGGGAPNLVGRHASGQCGFGVTPLNPAVEAGAGPGIPEHISTRIMGLTTSHGTYSEGAPVFSLAPVTTSSGDVVNGQVFDFTLAGTGLTGTGTYTGPPVGQSGAAVLSSVRPDGWTTFTVYLTCTCSYGGQSGTVGLRAYGTTSPNGLTTGTFLVTSGGGPAAGSLTTLAGFGTFTSRGQPAGTLRLTSHLGIT